MSQIEAGSIRAADLTEWQRGDAREQPKESKLLWMQKASA